MEVLPAFVMLQSQHLCLLSCKIALSSSDSRNFFHVQIFKYNFQNILQYLLTVNAKKLIAPFLSYSFLGGCFFMPHPVHCVLIKKVVLHTIVNNCIKIRVILLIL